MALHNFDGPSASLLQIQYLPGLVKQKKSTAVLSVCSLIRMLNQALSDVRVKNKGKRILTFVISCVTEQNLPSEEAPSLGCQGWVLAEKSQPGDVFRKWVGGGRSSDRRDSFKAQ